MRLDLDSWLDLGLSIVDLFLKPGPTLPTAMLLVELLVPAAFSGVERRPVLIGDLGRASLMTRRMLCKTGTELLRSIRTALGPDPAAADSSGMDACGLLLLLLAGKEGVLRMPTGLEEHPKESALPMGVGLCIGLGTRVEPWELTPSFMGTVRRDPIFLDLVPVAHDAVFRMGFWLSMLVTF